MLVIYWVMAALLLGLSWIRSRSLLHPHFMFTSMLMVLISDFLVRGSSDDVIARIPVEDLATYQTATAFVITAIVVATAAISGSVERQIFGSRAVSQKQPKHKAPQALIPPLETANQRLIILTGALMVATIEITKRLYATDWNLELIIDQMLGPRGARNWDVASESNTDNALFQLIRAVLPFSAVACAYLMVRGRNALAASAAVLFSVVLFILVTDGSRTSVVLPFAALIVFRLIYGRSVIAKVVTAVGSLGAVAFLTSLMYRFRSSGFLEQDISGGLVYHQDDSIYRTWFSYAFADSTFYRWDIWEWYYAILTQPVPRAIWPDKPELGAEFYGGFKLQYVTNSFMGESVALLGTSYGTAWSVLLALCLYYCFYRSIGLLRRPFGTPVYLIIALYVYMILRSTMNLTTFIYLPAAALVGFWLLNRSRFRGRIRSTGRPQPRPGALSKADW